MTTEPLPPRTGSSLRPLLGACTLLVLTLPLLFVMGRLGVARPIVLLVPVVLAGVVLARGWRPLCASRAAAVMHAVVLLVGALLLGGLTAFVVAVAAGVNDNTSVDHSIGALLVGVAVALFAPSLWLGALGLWDYRALVAKATAGR